MSSPNFFGICMRTYIFAHMMAAEKDKKVISVRPKEGTSLREELIALADKKKWSLNFYVVEVLENHVKLEKRKK